LDKNRKREEEECDITLSLSLGLLLIKDIQIKVKIWQHAIRFNLLFFLNKQQQDNIEAYYR